VRSNLMRTVLASSLSAALLAGCGSKEEAPPAAQQAAPAAEAPAADTEKTYELRRRLADSTSQEAEWVPELIATPADDVGDSLRRAEQAVAAGRLEQGENSALTIYLSVLETEPENETAIAGVDRVVVLLVERGEQALAQGRFSEASRLAQVVTRLRPENEAVLAFKAKIDAGREVATMITEAQRLATEGRIVAPEGANATAVYRDILRIDPSNAVATQGLAKLESDLLAAADAAAQAGNYG
jgi:predicted small lipoprotein YifL